MNRSILGANVYINGKFVYSDLQIENGIITAIAPAEMSGVKADEAHYIMPGFTDVHVHLREPGFSYKETILTGTRAAAHGGYTAVCAMPNLNPAPDNLENLKKQTDIIEKDACIHVYPYGTITAGQMGETLSDMESLAKKVVAFSDDGKGVQHTELMKAAMLQAKALGKIIVAHCEDNALLRGGYIHDGDYARAHGHQGICSESEWGPIARDIELASQTGCAYHVCHISTKESVRIIRDAKKAGVNITCETAPHYLLMNDSMLQEDGRFKMNPPIRSLEDQQALLEGLCDGTIDMIATDHAPHSAEEKSRGLKGSVMGVVGLETAFPLLYTALVRQQKLITLEKLVTLMAENPARRFGLPCGIRVGEKANLNLFDLNSQYEINPENFLSMGRSTPFTGWKVHGECLLTLSDGKAVWSK